MNLNLFIPIVSVVGAIIVCIINNWNQSRKLIQEREKVTESITSEIIKLRVEPYTEFMKSLKVLSTVNINKVLGEDEKKKDAEKVNELLNIIQNFIYGKGGLLASHETREMILRLRTKCNNFIISQKNQLNLDQDANNDFREVKFALWGVHQMLRADLNLKQPQMAEEVKRIRSKKIAASIEDIETIVSEIIHLDWESGQTIKNNNIIT